MTQAAVWDIQQAADAPVSPDAFASRLQDMLEFAELSNHRGTARPSYAVAGTIWNDSDDNYQYSYDGTNDRALAFRDRSVGILGSVSGVDTITAALTPTETSYANVDFVLLVTAGANTGAVTLNIDTIGARSVVKAGGTALAASDLANGAAYILWNDEANTRFQVVGL